MARANRMIARTPKILSMLLNPTSQMVRMMTPTSIIPPIRNTFPRCSLLTIVGVLSGIWVHHVCLVDFLAFVEGLDSVVGVVYI